MEEKIEKKKKSKVMPIILGFVILIGLVFGIREYLYYSTHEDTDDAQIDGDISPINARVQGYIGTIKFKDNQLVHKGDLLVIINDVDFQLRLEQAKAEINVAKANVGVAKSNVIAIQANTGTIKAKLVAANASLDKSKEDLKRYTNLYDQEAITKEQLDAARLKETADQSQVKALEEQLIAVNKNIETTKSQVALAESNVAMSKSAYDQVNQQLTYTKIYAPCDGIVSKRNIQIGQLVNPGQSLFVLVHSKDIYITANYKETQLTDITIGLKVNLKIDAFPKLKLTGRVESFSGATGAKFSLLPPNNASGNFVKVIQRVPIRISIDADDSILKKLSPGLSVETSVLINK